MWIELLAFAIQAEPTRPPRPTDDQLVVAFGEARPDADVLQHSGHNVTDGDGRVICGIARIDDKIEPFAAYAVWAPSYSFPTPNGSRETVSLDRWFTQTIAPAMMDHEGRRHAGVTRAVTDAASRRQIIDLCADLVPPEDVIWVTNF